MPVRIPVVSVVVAGKILWRAPERSGAHPPGFIPTGLTTSPSECTLGIPSF
jgi:hypothetical protein